MLRAKWHTYQVLTKRADRLRQLLTTKLSEAAAAPHIWWGVSVEDKKYGLPRLAELQKTPARIRFLSIEPLLEDLGTVSLSGVDWVIVGGESGCGARRMDPAWVTAIHTQCVQSKVPFFFKQWGGVQKSKYGRLLNGRTYDEMPPVATEETPSKEKRRAMLKALAPLAQASQLTQLERVPGLRRLVHA